MRYRHNRKNVVKSLLKKGCIIMNNNGKRYSEEFKQQIIDLYLKGEPIAQLAEEYGLVEQTIYRWKRLYAPSIQVDDQTVSLKDYKELQKRIQELEMENEILKKATAIFARKR